MVDFIANYYKNIESYLVLSQVQPGYLRTCLPETALIDPYPTMSSAAFLGDMLCTCFNARWLQLASFSGCD
ncbi:hypothetical protein ACSBR2_027562 [Camellia fascicularis]